MIELPSKIDNIFKNIKQLSPKELGIRKKLDIFIAIDEDDKVNAILHIVQKSRFLQKDVDKIEEILNIVKDSKEENIDNKVIVIESPLCSKAKVKLENLSWKVIV